MIGFIGICIRSEDVHTLGGWDTIEFIHTTGVLYIRLVMRSAFYYIVCIYDMSYDRIRLHRMHTMSFLSVYD